FLYAFQVFGRERLAPNEIIEEAIVDRGTDAQFYVRKKFDDRGGKQMRGGMAQYLNCLGILRSENCERSILIEGTRKIPQFAVNASNQRFFFQPRRNLPRDFGRSCPSSDFALRSVRQRDLYCAHRHF